MDIIYSFLITDRLRQISAMEYTEAYRKHTKEGKLITVLEKEHTLVVELRCPVSIKEAAKLEIIPSFLDYLLRAVKENYATLTVSVP